MVGPFPPASGVCWRPGLFVAPGKCDLPTLVDPSGSAHFYLFFTDLLVWYSTCSLHFGTVSFLAYLSAWSIILPVCSGFSNWALFPLYRYIRYFLSSRALVCFITMRTWCLGREECSDCSWLYCTILYSIYYLIYNKPLLAQSLFRHITMAHLSLGYLYSFI